VKLSIVIPCYNCEDVIATQLSALAEQVCNQPWEVIVADNGSSDQTLAVVERYRSRLPHLKIVDASQRRGASHARNVAIAEADGDFILFCDGDDEVQPGWLQAMANAFEKHDFIAGALNLEKLNEPWRVPKSHLFGTPGSPQTEACQYRHLPARRYAPAANLGIKKSLHLKVGGFDETVQFNQDLDYCLRVQALGYGLFFVPDSVVEYRLRHDLLKTYRQFYRWGRYSIFIYRRHIGLGSPLQRLKFLVGGWRHLPGNLITTRTKADWFDLVSWLGGRLGEMHGCLEFLIFPNLLSQPASHAVKAQGGPEQPCVVEGVRK
jgi:glycosyltransferase involved in cell wall biosynthesis